MIPHATQLPVDSPAPREASLLATVGALPSAGSEAQLCSFFLSCLALPHLLTPAPFQLGTFPKVC